jgi:hypothetical protein
VALTHSRLAQSWVCYSPLPLDCPSCTSHRAVYIIAFHVFRATTGRRNPLTTFSVTVTDLYFHLGDAARRLRWPLGRGLSPGTQRSPPSRLIDATRAGADAVSGRRPLAISPSCHSTSRASAPDWARRRPSRCDPEHSGSQCFLLWQGQPGQCLKGTRP